MADDFTFNIEKEFGVLSTSKSGWQTKLCLVSWGNRDAKYDLRSWSPDMAKMSKGISLTAEELTSLKNILNSLTLPEA
ncbi:MAG: PC4/YdbC family ssDNA-binding protein [Spirochaetales bacterium]